MVSCIVVHRYACSSTETLYGATAPLCADNPLILFEGSYEHNLDTISWVVLGHASASHLRSGYEGCSSIGILLDCIDFNAFQLSVSRHGVWRSCDTLRELRQA